MTDEFKETSEDRFDPALLYVHLFGAETRGGKALICIV